MSRSEHFLNRFILQTTSPIPKEISVPVRDAAVIIPLILRAEGWVVLFTQRSWQLRHHPGQICFPGGRKDAEDISLQMTGLRELEEELGISPQYVNIIGEVSGGQTLSGYQIHPYLAILHPTFHLHPAKSEVEAVFELPLETLLNKNNYHSLQINRNGKTHKIVAITVNGWFIWGATARMLHQLAKHYG